MIDFAIEYGYSPPPSEELVLVFLTNMFLDTPSGYNCRAALFAIKNMCKLFGFRDLTEHYQVTDLIKGMCNLSPVAQRRNRSPWSIEFIERWIQSGLRFVDYRNYVLYTTIMIIDLRTMFRGSELGGIMKEDIDFVTCLVIGMRILVRHIKNRKEGRTACVETTGNSLCPLRWINKLMSVRPSGPYLFAGIVFGWRQQIYHIF
ncbi:hypothetical protein FDP41_002577 [Naegleria fowleri]|uniref:Uncharacterized protein n=1 Tax=Naegleria fowleri TaxID=5763 RepID=A0A6A5BTK6_NAEFO|nr:uncharacterized protein FDP41_002577 [Naegleria fowleri]KAF0978062.1 hypothetical protein FDP41_002577 [Naegleria fowleri]